jgi:hypothetical protein
MIDTRYQRVLDGLPTGWNQQPNIKPIWITEVGFPSIRVSADQPPASERRQRRKLRETYFRFAVRDRVKAFIIHRLIDSAAEPRGFGVLREDLSRKLVFCDLADWVEFYQEPLNPTCTGS